MMIGRPWQNSRAAGRSGFRAPAGEPRLTAWPVKRPANWSFLVNQALDEGELKRVRQSVSRDGHYPSV